MTDQEIKILFSRKVLNLEDRAKEAILRHILLCTYNNVIDWQDAYRVMIANMPELTK